MTNSSTIAQLPADRLDVEALSRKVQLLTSAIDQIAGNTATKTTKTLSPLEGSTEVDISTLPDALTAITQLRTNLSTLTQSVSELTDTVNAALEDIDALIEASQFIPLLDTNLDSLNWDSFTGRSAGAASGASISNPPYVLNGASTYSLVLDVAADGAFSQSLHIIGNSENRYFKRSGLSFTAALANGWIEL